MPAFRINRSSWNMAEFRRIRNSEGIVADFQARGSEWVERLNTELAQYEAKDHQEIEPGYDFTVTHGSGHSRARLYIGTIDARAAAHEARHQSLLKAAVIGESVHAGDPVDPNLPEELAKRVKKRAVLHKRRQNAKIKKWLRAEALHKAANLSESERSARVQSINDRRDKP